MNKNLAIVVTVIVLMIAGGFIFLSTQSDDDGMESSQFSASSPSQNINTPQEDTSTPETTDNYIEYSDAALASADGTKLLFFHASWCPQCRALEEDILANGVPAGVTIFKVDFDNSQDLKEKYGVTQQTTVAKVDDDGNLVEKFVPYNSPSLKNVQENLL